MIDKFLGENIEIAFLAIHLSVYNPGDKIYKSEAEARDFWLHPWEYQAEPITNDPQKIWQSGEVWEFYGTALAMDFQAFGEAKDFYYSCGMACEIADMHLDIFEEEERQKIIDLGKDDLTQFDDFGQHCHYVVAVKCRYWKEEDTWAGPGEYESTYEVLGRVDLENVNLKAV